MLTSVYQINSAEFVNILSRSFGLLIRALWSFFVSIYIPIDQFGKYSVIKTEAGLLGQIGLLGTPQIILRRSEQIGSPLLFVFHSIILLIVVWILSGTLLHRGFHFIVFLLALSQVLFVISSLWIRRNHRFSAALIGEIFFAIVLFIGILMHKNIKLQALTWFLYIEALASGIVSVFFF
jgi:O-antigen/teichoic acid export membrane protein